MRPLINFASEPFRNHRLLWLLIGLIIFSASLVGLNILNSQAALEKQITDLEPKVKALETKVKNGEPLDFNGSALTVAQNQSLIAAQELITRKGFSWSQLLNDLEQYVPGTVRVTRIGLDKVGGVKSKENIAQPEANAIFLSFDAVGKSSTAMTQMISELNRSAKFSVNPKSVRPIEGTDDVEFQLQVEYRPTTFSSSQVAVQNTQIAAQAVTAGEVRK